MKLKIVSDIHLEFSSVKKCLLRIGAEESPDTILILAGDIGYPIKNITKNKSSFKLRHKLPIIPKINEMYVDFLKTLKRMYKEVIMVSGNHEYYTCLVNNISICELDEIISSICVKIGVIFLQNSSVEIEGYTFYGCTLFSNVTMSDFFCMNDSNKITSNISNIHECFNNSLNWLKLQNINENSLIITHHLPTYELYPKYLDVNTAYFTEIFKDFVSFPKLWICGHSHSAKDIKIDNTRFIINPLGYPGEKTEYTDKIVEI